MTQESAMTTDELRAKFEAQHTCSYGHRRSRRGSYVNPPTQRDWKWFQAGAAVAAKPLPPLLGEALSRGVGSGYGKKLFSIRQRLAFGFSGGLSFLCEGR